MEIGEVGLEVHRVVLPGQADRPPAPRPSSGSRNARPQDVEADVVQERRELLLPVPGDRLPYAVLRLGHGCPAPGPDRALQSRLPLDPAPWLPRLRGGHAALFAGFPATTGGSDFSGPCIIGYGLRPSRRGPGIGARDGLGDLRFPRGRLARMPGSSDDAEPAPPLAITRRPVWPSAHAQPSAPRTVLLIAARWLACALPCQRFAPGLADRARMARGRCGSLLLHRRGLAPPTSRRSPGARLNYSPERRSIAAVSPADLETSGLGRRAAPRLPQGRGCRRPP